MTETSVGDLLREYAPYPRKTTATGFTNHNCPCCVASGEGRPDNKGRGGFRIDPDGSAFYHCHNCSISTGWRPGESLSRRMSFVLRCFGVPDNDIKRLNFHLYRDRQNSTPTQTARASWQRPTFPAITLPQGSRPLLEWLQDPDCPQDAFDVATYLEGRGDAILIGWQYYWTPSRQFSLNRRVIIPFFHDGKIVGFTSRLIDRPTPRIPKYYIGAKPDNFIFNSRVLDLPNRKYVIVTEGPLDAIAIDGVSVMTKSITNQQAQWLKSSGKTIIILPDGSPDKKALIDYALPYVKSMGWMVSFPWMYRRDKQDGMWGRSIKDAADAIQQYGQIYTIRSIIDRATDQTGDIILMKDKLLNPE